MEVEVRPVYKAFKLAIPLPIISPVNVLVPKIADDAVTFKKPARVDVAFKLLTVRLVRVVVPNDAVPVAVKLAKKISPENNPLP